MRSKGEEMNIDGMVEEEEEEKEGGRRRRRDGVEE